MSAAGCAPDDRYLLYQLLQERALLAGFNTRASMVATLNLQAG